MLAVAIGGLSAVLGPGCAGVKAVAPPVTQVGLGQIQGTPSTGTSWSFVPEPRGRWYPSAVLLPDDGSARKEGSSARAPWCFVPEPSGRWCSSAVLLPGPEDHWSEVHGSSSAYPHTLWLTKEGWKGNPQDVAGGAGEEWWKPESRRPAIVGRVCGAPEGGKEILEVGVAQGERIGSIALVAVETLAGGSADGVVRLPFRDLGPAADYGAYGHRLLEVADRPIPPGVYLLVVVTESGAPSTGQLVLVGGSRSSREGE